MANPDSELSILFTDDIHIAQLNRQYLGRDGPTNVLAFPMSGGSPPHIESGMLGDVVISVDTAIRESKKLKKTLDEIIYRLLIHGILHLLGYSDKTEDQKVAMRKKEDSCLSLYFDVRSEPSI